MSCAINPRVGFVFTVLFAANSAVGAEDTIAPIGELFDAQRNQWQEVESSMSAEEYREATLRNRRFVTNALHDTAVSLGVPEKAIAVTGAAIAIAAGDPKVHLNKSKTMALQLKDAVNRDRSIFFSIKLDWH